MASLDVANSVETLVITTDKLLLLLLRIIIFLPKVLRRSVKILSFKVHVLKSFISYIVADVGEVQ